MLYKTRGVLYCAVVGIVVLIAIVPAVGQRQRIALFVQAVAPVPPADVEILKGFANQRCAVIADVDVCSVGETMYAQRLANVYVGSSISVKGLRQLAQILDVDHFVIFRIVRWNDQISFNPEISLVFLGVSSFLDNSLQLLASPLGILVGLD